MSEERRDLWQFQGFAGQNSQRLYFVGIARLFDIAENQSIHPEIVFHAANIFGRYLSTKQIFGPDLKVILFATMIVSEDYVITWRGKMVENQIYTSYVKAGSNSFSLKQLYDSVKDIRNHIHDFSLTPYDFLMDDLKTSKITNEVFDRAFVVILQNVAKYALNTRYDARTIATSAEIIARGTENEIHDSNIDLCLRIMSDPTNKITKITETYFRRTDLETYLRNNPNRALEVLYVLLGKFMNKIDNSYIELSDCYTKNWFIDAKRHPITSSVIENVISGRNTPESEQLRLVKHHYRQKLINDVRTIANVQIYSLPEYIRDRGFDQNLEVMVDDMLEYGSSLDPNHMSTDPNDMIFINLNDIKAVYIVKYPYSSFDPEDTRLKRYLELYYNKPYNQLSIDDFYEGTRIYFGRVVLYTSISKIIPSLKQDLIHYVMTHSRDDHQMIYQNLLDNAYLDIQLFGEQAFLGSYSIDPNTGKLYRRTIDEIEYDPDKYPDFDIVAIPIEQLNFRLRDYLFDRFLSQVNQILDVNNKITSYTPNLFSKVTSIYDDKTCEVGWTIDRTVKGKGSFGITYGACCQKSCGDYVMKFVRFAEPMSQENFKRETDIGIEMSRLNIGPKIVAVSSDDNVGLIVMEAMNITMDSILDYLKFLTETQEQKIDPDVVETVRTAVRYIFVKVLELVRAIHTAGYYHGDLHMGNVMIKLNDLNQNPEIVEAIKTLKYPLPGNFTQIFSSIKVCLIDYGLSSLCPINGKRQKADGDSKSDCLNGKIKDYLMIQYICNELHFTDLADFAQRDINALNREYGNGSLQSV